MMSKEEYGSLEDAWTHLSDLLGPLYAEPMHPALVRSIFMAGASVAINLVGRDEAARAAVGRDLKKYAAAAPPPVRRA